MSRLYKDIVCTLEDANSNFDSDGFIATTAEGHLLVVDYNIFTKRAYVKYPIYENSVQILSQVFAWLDANYILVKPRHAAPLERDRRGAVNDTSAEPGTR